MKFNKSANFLLLTLSVYLPLGFSQNKPKNSTNNQESYQNLPDGIIKREVSSFTKMGAKNPIFAESAIKLIEFPIYNCSGSHVGFHHKKQNRRVSIYANAFDASGHQLIFDKFDTTKLLLIDNKPFWGTNGSIPDSRFYYVSYIHVKYVYRLPSSAFDGLYEPKFCTFIPPKKKVKETKPTKNITEVFARAFCSADGKRVYIYMVNGEENARYEVTWILQNGEYDGRVIDNL